jgi:acetoin utilization deacetylase AcuC-like enzyme
LSECTTALILHADCGRHDTGWSHPEHQGRLPAIVHALERDTPALLERVHQQEGTYASEAQLLRVHTSAHVDLVRNAAVTAERTGTLINLDPDTIVSPASWDAARAAAGCAIDAAHLVLHNGVRSAFALTRPPGHHATASRPMGFCLFNNAAVAARAVQAEHGIERVLIVDWDVHHGNGTQDVFWRDGSVFYYSLHQHPLYPGTGRAADRGEGEGEGTTLNRPLPAGFPVDEYLGLFTEDIERIAKDFEPDLVLVSAGFDAHRADPLGGLPLETKTFAELTHIVRKHLAKGRVSSVLEGGYDLTALADSVRAHLHALRETRTEA